ncbi:ASCH domain-containing protein [Anaerospora hongkongensis]|uniref:ASCH domain-containing protein n=1 Tax=Anaerospora hongkongensis TaxID=244830 RepID=A0A4V6NGC4_9FIRM|nr:ASCH domain-containing protein [Anaerospora hongkongensis]TCL40003.1 ASCH domain-containing protein [Anaerospora hongkongensis]
MKAITILQPWASLIARKVKGIETRSWSTKYRGPIAIHAGANWSLARREITYRDPFHSALWPSMTKEELAMNGYGRTQLLPVGAVIAIADLVDCLQVVDRYMGLVSGVITEKVRLLDGRVIFGHELKFGDYTRGRYAWILANVRRIDPAPAKGMQRLWEWPVEKWRVGND